MPAARARETGTLAGAGGSFKSRVTTQVVHLDLESLGTGATGWTGSPAQFKGPNLVVHLDLESLGTY